VKLRTSSDLRKMRDMLLGDKPFERTVYICGGTGCRAGESEKLALKLRDAVSEHNLSVLIKETGCHGLCEKGPLMVIDPEGVFYERIKADDIDEIVSKTLIDGVIINRLLYRDEHNGIPVEKEKDISFYKFQKRRIFALNGRISPTCFEDYIRSGGYISLVKALESMSPEEIIGEVEASGLRGRGGGGFPTGRKWRSCRDVLSDKHYIICNADEGDPGAYMDRSLLEGNPHSVLEGMLIGARAIGADEGYIYVREEYPLAVANVTKAISDARQWGLLGQNILDSGLSFDLKVTKGGGAFVCGESTALMKSLEGNRGEPRSKHIHTVESGLYGRPTNLNNVETWANIPLIIQKSAAEYNRTGTKGSRGTKIFSLVGKVRNTGLIEVPMGMTLREIIFDLGGGIPGDKAFKAVQTGGPSGGCIPLVHLDVKVDFDELKKLGSMMGSGGMIVMDEDTCMVEVARFYTSFLMDESCGKCTPCREGLWQLLSILTRICHGEGKDEDLITLEELGEMIKDASLCALGKTAPNPVLSTLRYFREEYWEHITEKKCRAGVCRDLFQYTIDKEKCTGCALCRIKCPYNAIEGENKGVHLIHREICTKCGICFEVCKFDAVKKVS